MMMMTMTTTTAAATTTALISAASRSSSSAHQKARRLLNTLKTTTTTTQTIRYRQFISWLPPPSRSAARLFSSSSSLSLQSSIVEAPKYTLALTREIPETFQNAITKYHHDLDIADGKSGTSSSSSTSIDLQRAKDQHAYYVEQLRQIVPNVVVLPPLNQLPDSVFVEDTVVVVDQIAVMTRPGHPSRRPEVHDFKMQLREYAPSSKLIVGDMNMYTIPGSNDSGNGSEADSSVVCDGGDVLYTGRHLFVGLSSRTNRKAVDVLKTTFGFYGDDDDDDDEDDDRVNKKTSSDNNNNNNNNTVVVVPVEPKAFADDALHLKSVVTAVDSRTLLAPTGVVGDQVLKEMGAYEKGYDVVRLPSMLACNVVSANGGLLAQDGGCSESKSILQDMANTKQLNLHWVDCSELAKADAALTCCSVLLNV